MEMTRRGFLGTVLALGAAPAIVRAGNIMRVYDRPSLWGTMHVPGRIERCRDIIETVDYADGITRYSYSADVEYGVPSGASILRLWANGRLLWEKGQNIQPAFHVSREGVLRFKEPLDLTPFGNCVPRLDVEARA